MNNIKRIKLSSEADDENSTLRNDSQSNSSPSKEFIVTNYFNSRDTSKDNKNEPYDYYDYLLDSREQVTMPDLGSEFLKSVIDLNTSLDSINFEKPVQYVYNPTIYAFDMFKTYIDKYCYERKEIIFLGMNPGPWGMSQTGIPFGEVSSVKEWLQIEGLVTKPAIEAPSRPVLGLQCHRIEVSGERFWALIKELCGTPENFFRTSFVHNYCPLQLMTSTGKNITPSELELSTRKRLYEVCDKALMDVINILKAKIIICVGKFTETRLNSVLKEASVSDTLKVLCIPHPSPRSLGNNNWIEKTTNLIESFDLLHYFAEP